MNNYYLTFNKKHKHPTDTTQSLISYWVKIVAQDEETARNVADIKYKGNWAALYPEHEFDKTFFPSGELERIIQNGKN